METQTRAQSDENYDQTKDRSPLKYGEFSFDKTFSKWLTINTVKGLPWRIALCNLFGQVDRNGGHSRELFYAMTQFFRARGQYVENYFML